MMLLPDDTDVIQDGGIVLRIRTASLHRPMKLAERKDGRPTRNRPEPFVHSSRDALVLGAAYGRMESNQRP